MGARHTYPLSLTNAEFETIRFLASRGYCVNLYEALSSEHTTTDETAELATYFVPEWLAWEVHTELENNGGHGFGPVSADLEAKLYAFVDRIV